MEMSKTPENVFPQHGQARRALLKRRQRPSSQSKFIPQRS
ncbi:hypothetical protein Ga0080574_TMP4207 [Salipiger abyssi]|uniref:Uncharacterized protein n=1 Tax=Salipiger abyssi TaxID=1250539 RepID=A0A1P8UYS5_9RHOB|nr:hypothetical protein Ga0080574_TMP4207 [Salipiger abyssi]